MEGLDRSSTVEDAVVVAGKATDLKRRGSYPDAEGAKTLRPTLILQRTVQTMETPNCCRWSELPMDTLRYLLEHLSFFDFHRAKMVCSNWYLCSKQTLRSKFGSPLLMLSPKEGGCRLYNPDEDKVYETKINYSEYRFLASSGKWFLVLDSQSDLYIIDVFSEERIRLPPLESIKGGRLKIEQAENNIFKARFVSGMPGVMIQSAEDLRGLLWVDEKTREYVVVWQFDNHDYLGFCKKGDVHYREVTTRVDVPLVFQGQKHMVLKGYSLYILTIRAYIRHLDLSGEVGFKDVSVNHRFPIQRLALSANEIERRRGGNLISYSNNIVVATSGEVLFVHTEARELTTERHRIFHVYKRDPKDLDPNTYDTELIEVYTLGDEALFLDLGITVPADRTLGIEPNSIYFTRDDRIRHKKHSCLDICVYNLATKTTKRFPSLSGLDLKDAQWFIPS